MTDDASKATRAACQCDCVPCPSCRSTGKRADALCGPCEGSGLLPAALCQNCQQRPSQCACAPRCGHTAGVHFFNGREERLGTRCGKLAVAAVKVNDWRSIHNLFDPINELRDALRCADHVPRGVDVVSLDADETIGRIRRTAEEGGWRIRLGELAARGDFE